MSQKSNLITIRKKNSIDLVTQNPKLWVSFLKVFENTARLFILKGVWLTKYSISLDTNFVSLYFFLYFQSSTTRKYKKKLKKKKLKIKLLKAAFKKKKSDESLFIKKYNKKKSLRLKNRISKGRKKQKKLLNFLSSLLSTNSFNAYNSFFLRIINLNRNFRKKLIRRQVNFFYKKLNRQYLNVIFSRRQNLFLDFIKLTVLYINNFISIDVYSQLWSRIFKFLSKRTHGKFFQFAKRVFKLLSRVPYRFYYKRNQVLGVKFIISGRLKGKQRSNSKLIKVGKVPTQTFSKKVEFFAQPSHTLYGVFGLKFWIYKNKIHKKLHKKYKNKILKQTKKSIYIKKVYTSKNLNKNYVKRSKSNP